MDLKSCNPDEYLVHAVSEGNSDQVREALLAGAKPNAVLYGPRIIVYSRDEVHRAGLASPAQLIGRGVPGRCNVAPHWKRIPADWEIQE